MEVFERLREMVLNHENPKLYFNQKYSRYDSDAEMTYVIFSLMDTHGWSVGVCLHDTDVDLAKGDIVQVKFDEGVKGLLRGETEFANLRLSKR